jgi:hypothetical protein
MNTYRLRAVLVFFVFQSVGSFGQTEMPENCREFFAQMVPRLRDLSGGLIYSQPQRFSSDLKEWIKITSPRNPVLYIGGQDGQSGLVFYWQDVSNKRIAIKAYRLLPEALRDDLDLERLAEIILPDDNIQVVRSELPAWRSLRFNTYIDGFTLASLFERKSLSPEEANYYQNIFLNGMADLSDRLEAKGFKTTFKVSRAQAFPSVVIDAVKPGKAHQFILHGENVMVERNTGRIFIVDPN